MEYDPKNVAEYVDDMKRNGKSATQKAAELGVGVGTLNSAILRYKRRGKRPAAKTGPKVKVVDIAAPVAKRDKSIPELLAGIDFNVAAIKKVLGIS